MGSEKRFQSGLIHIPILLILLALVIIGSIFFLRNLSKQETTETQERPREIEDGTFEPQETKDSQPKFVPQDQASTPTPLKTTTPTPTTTSPTSQPTHPLWL